MGKLLPQAEKFWGVVAPGQIFLGVSAARTFYYRDLIQLTRFLLFAAPYLLQIPAALMCILSGTFLPSAQCQHIYWSSHVKHRIIDNRMKIDYKNFLNHKEASDMYAQNTFDRFDNLHKQYVSNSSAFESMGPKNLSRLLVFREVF